jgi:hypothetical protein
MGIIRLLIISFLILACIAPLTAQTKQLPAGCMYMREFALPPLKNPFPRLVPEMPFPQDGVSLTRIVVPPQFRVRNLATGGDSGVNHRSETGTQPLSVVCGTIRFH